MTFPTFEHVFTNEDDKNFRHNGYYEARCPECGKPIILCRDFMPGSLNLRKTHRCELWLDKAR
jgi:hypothetical protein